MSKAIPAKYGGDSIREKTLEYGGQSITDHEIEAVLEALQRDYITRGPIVDEFEDRVAEHVGVEHAIATTSGTTALHVGGLAAGFGPDDEVVTTPFTFVSTAFSATYAGATPVFADIDPRSRTLDPGRVEGQITEDTEGLVPMHYSGHPADIEGLLAVAEEHELTVLWDACHGFGGTWRGEPLGSQRDLAVFSFHPVKNITTGEGGMVVTDDDEIASRARRLRSFDMNRNPKGHRDEPWYQVVEGEGFNYNVTDIQAALGLAQLDRLDEFKTRRQDIIERYEDAFAELEGIKTPPEPVESVPVYHLYSIEVQEGFGCDRSEFVTAMHAENIGVQVHYVPLHYHPFFQNEYGYARGMFPQTERVYERVVSLPLSPAMCEDDATDVINAIQRLHRYHAE